MRVGWKKWFVLAYWFYANFLAKKLHCSDWNTSWFIWYMDKLEGFEGDSPQISILHECLWVPTIFLHIFTCILVLVGSHTHTHRRTHTCRRRQLTLLHSHTRTQHIYFFLYFFFPSAKRVLPHFSLLYIWLVAAAATLLEFFTYKNLQRRHTHTHI